MDQIPTLISYSNALENKVIIFTKVTLVEIFTSNWLNPKMWITNSMSSGSLTEVG